MITQDTKYDLSLHAVGGGEDDGGVTGEQCGAAAVPALVTPEH